MKAWFHASNIHYSVQFILGPKYCFDDFLVSELVFLQVVVTYHSKAMLSQPGGQMAIVLECIHKDTQFVYL